MASEKWICGRSQTSISGRLLSSGFLIFGFLSFWLLVGSIRAYKAFAKCSFNLFNSVVSGRYFFPFLQILLSISDCLEQLHRR